MDFDTKFVQIQTCNVDKCICPCHAKLYRKRKREFESFQHYNRLMEFNYLDEIFPYTHPRPDFTIRGYRSKSIFNSHTIVKSKRYVYTTVKLANEFFEHDSTKSDHEILKDNLWYCEPGMTFNYQKYARLVLLELVNIKKHKDLRYVRQEVIRFEDLVEFDNRIMDKYDEKRQHVPSIIKLKCNHKFRDMLGYFKRPNRRVIILETEALITTRTIVETGQFYSGKNQILIPTIHPTFEGLDKNLTKYIQVFVNTRAVHLCRDIVIDNKDNKDNAEGFDFGLDYCCTLTRLEDSPLADLAMIFQRQLLAKSNGVLWMTFSCRQKYNSRQKTIHNVEHVIQNLASQYKYRIIRVEVFDYMQEKKIDNRGTRLSTMIAFYYVTY